MMNKTLILTEKPSVARDFAKALKISAKGSGFFENDNYIITWAIGHLYTPFNPDDYDKSYKRWSMKTLPIIPPVILYKPVYKTKKQLGIVNKQLKRRDVEKIIVATDAGREGELIARTILINSKVSKKCLRFWTSQALTTNVILEELSKCKPLGEYNRLFNAGQARQIADWLVGMNLSRAATLKMGDLFSVGRVQTAVLSMLVDRRKEIDRFVPKQYFKIKGRFAFKSGIVEAFWFDGTKKKEQSRIDELDIAKSLIEKLNGKPCKIDLLTHEEKEQISPPLFSLTDLQRTANRRYGFPAKKTLSIAQTLYEKYKCLSYPRTDATVLGNKSFPLVKNLLEKFKESNPDYFEYFDESKVSFKNRWVFNDSKLTDHHALIPLKPFKGNQNTDLFKIYDLVLRRFMMVFSKNYKFLESNVVIGVRDELFKTRGVKTLVLGWKSLGYHEADSKIPELEQGEIGETKKLSLEELMTKPPSEYTENLLLKDMANPSSLVSEKELKQIFKGQVGLGTQATRAQIIETLIDRKYVTRAKKILKATDKGITLVDLLREMKSGMILVNPSYTAKWEIFLEEIANGMGESDAFLDQIKDFVVKSVYEWGLREDVKRDWSKSGKNGAKKKSGEIIGTCPSCGSNIVENNKAYSCESWKKGCKFVIWKVICKKSISPRQAKKLLKTGKTDFLKGWKSKKGRPFQARLALNGKNGPVFEFSSE